MDTKTVHYSLLNTHISKCKRNSGKNWKDTGQQQNLV